MEYPYVENGLVYFNEDTIIVNDDVEMKWGSSNKKHYVDLGYEFTKMGESFLVDIKDLTKGSNIRVFAICTRCKSQRDIIFQSLIKVGHSKCLGCAQIIDRTGKRYEYCEILEYHDQDKWNQTIWKCLCRCDQVFYTLGKNLENGNTTSCGCRQREIQRERMGTLRGNKNPMYGIRGEDHHSWNPNLTDEDRNKRRSPEDEKWAKEIKQLDKFTCQCCNQSVSGKLVSHHLNGYKDFPEQRLNLDNGVTLCKHCHNQFHSWLGGTHTICTRDDLVQFCEEFYPNAIFIS